jgi:polyisoprenoid-binding protein YceI
MKTELVSVFFVPSSKILTMEDNLIGIILLILGAVSVIGSLHLKQRFVHYWFLVLTTVFVAYFSFGNVVGFEDGIIDKNPLYLGVSILFLALVLYRITQADERRARLGFIGLFFPLLFLLLGAKTYAFGGNGFSGMDLVKVGVLGAMTPIAFWVIFGLFRKVGFDVRVPDDERIQSALEVGFVYLMMAGVGIAGSFLAGPFGVFAALVSYLSASMLTGFFIPQGQKAVVPFVLVFALLLPLTRLTEIGQAENLSLLQGKIFSGLFFGALVVVFHAVMLIWAQRMNGFQRFVLLFKSILLPMLIILITGMLYFTYEAFGGTEAVIAVLIGAALAIPLIHLVIPDSAFGSAALLLGSAILFTPLFTHPVDMDGPSLEGLNQSTSRVVVVAEDGSQQELDILDLNEAKGDWLVNTENSVLNFTLEASGSNTKGKFRSFSGQFSVGEDWRNAVMDIVIPVNSISTFNKVRDESLLDDAAFFEEAKFPQIKFVVKKLSLTETGYLAEGDFTLKGKTKKVPVIFKFVGRGDRDGKAFIVLKGTGSLNRTDFGMTPDPGIGDVVNFEFQTEFLAK